MKYKIGIGINYWDDPYGLLRILQSPIYELVHTIFVIDGRYKGRKDKPESLISMKEILKTYDKIHYVKMRDTIQLDKRNRYWELAEETNLDFMIKVDSDEVVDITDLKAFEKDLDLIIDFDKCQGFPVSFENMMQATKMIRLWRRPFDFRHRQNTGPNISHSQLFKKYGKGNIEMIGQFQKWYDYKGQGENVKGLQMAHDKTYRSKKRVDMDYVYYGNNPTR